MSNQRNRRSGNASNLRHNSRSLQNKNRNTRHNQGNNVTPLRHPININLGVIFFAVIFIYLLLYFFTYVGQKKISGYQVVSGSLSVNNIYRGVAIRDEKEFVADGAGYINYYASEGLKSACGNLVYTLDATGELGEIMADSEKGNLTDEELISVQSEIKNFKNEFVSGDFSTVYGFSKDLNSLVSRYRATNIMDNINTLNQATGSAEVRLIRAETSGIVVYSHDGYENITKDSVLVKDLSEEGYEETHLNSNTLVAPGDLVYKMITSEDWYVAIEIDEATAKRLMDQSYIEVRFLKTQKVSWASCEIKYSGDGIILFLGFNNSMVTFATDRFIDIELLLDKETGLKIPNSAIEEKEFYLIPIAYVTKSGADELSVLVEGYDEEGKLTATLRPIDVYYQNDEYFYVSKDCLETGTYLIPQNTLLPSNGYLDSDEIRDSYTVPEESSLGIISNEVNEDDQVIYDDGEPIVIPGGSLDASNHNSSGSDSSDNNSSNAEETNGDSSGKTSTAEGADLGEDSSDEANGAKEGSDSTQNTDGENTGNEDANQGQTSNQATIDTSQKFAVSLTGTLIGVYNMNKGYADFRQITILYQNDEYAIVKPNTMYGLCEYDYIVLDASCVSDNDLIY